MHACNGQLLHCIKKPYLYLPGFFSVPGDVPRLDPGFYACVNTNCTAVRIFWKVIIFIILKLDDLKHSISSKGSFDKFKR